MDLIFATKVLKYLNQREKSRNQNKAGAGELFASLTPAKLAQNIDETRDDFQLLENRVTTFAYAK